MPQLPLTHTVDKALKESIGDIAKINAKGDIAVRTVEGLQALVASLLPVAREQERLVAGVLNDASFFSRVLPFLPRVHVIAEPTILLLLAGNTIARAGEITPGHYASLEDYAEEVSSFATHEGHTAPTAKPQTLESSSLWQVTGGLLAGTVARVSKNSAEKSADLRTPSRWGVRAVVLSNLGYSAAALGAGARPQGKMIGAYAGVWAAGAVTALAAARKKKVSKQMVPAVIFGGASSAMTAALVSDESVFRSGSVAARGASHGANLLLASESLTFARALMESDIESKPHKRHIFKRGLYNLFGGVETTAAFIGHLLLADGLNRR